MAIDANIAAVVYCIINGGGHNQSLPLLFNYTLTGSLCNMLLYYDNLWQAELTMGDGMTQLNVAQLTISYEYDTSSFITKTGRSF